LTTISLEFNDDKASLYPENFGYHFSALIVGERSPIVCRVAQTRNQHEPSDQKASHGRSDRPIRRKKQLCLLEPPSV
jgi:hypothetical protein